MRRNKIALLFLLLTAITPVRAAEETALVTEGKINVRGKPALIGEVVTQLERGDKVTVLERITLDKPKPNEPTNWARIKLPANTPVWVFAPFVKDGKVAATRLNLRAGPGEAHDVIGRLSRGDDVKAIRTVTEWTEIEAPTDAYAFIDLTLVRFEGDTNAAPPTIVATPQPQQPEQTSAPAVPTATTPTAQSTPTETPATTTVTPTEPAVTPPAERPADPTTTADKSTIDTAPVIQPAPTNVAAAPETPAPATTAQARPETAAAPLPQVAQPLPAKPEEPLPKRVVRREGVIRATKSIQAPTWFELANEETGKTVNYLYDQKFSANSGIQLKDYRGKKVMVSGEEAIDQRWPNTPIMAIETLDVLP